MQKNNVFKVFVDFDGTITKLDVGEELFLEFGDGDFARSLIDQWHQGNVIPRVGWQKLCGSIRKADKEAMLDFIEKIEIEPTFKDFAEYCNRNSIDLFIISDGFDFYIRRILEKENLSHLKFSSNQLIFTEDGRIYPKYLNAAEDCSCAANCKRNFVLNNSDDSDYTVYIGDGTSDRCPVQYCDFIFAKKSLLRFCEMNRISYFPYKDFTDIINRLDELKNKKRLKKRHQAELKRQEAYKME